MVSAAGYVSAANAFSSVAMLGDGLIGVPAALLAPLVDINAPTIHYIYFDGHSIINNDYVRTNAAITSKITDDSGLDLNRCSVEVDGQGVGFQSSSGGTSFTNDVLTLQRTFADGSHTLKINAYDLSGNYTASSTIAFKVRGGSSSVAGPVLCYKNPFNPGAGESTNITYTLTQNTDITIFIYNMIGQLIKKINCPSGAQGGMAGYNQVPWDGYSDFKEMVGNDVYFVKVVSGGNVIGKTKIAVLK